MNVRKWMWVGIGCAGVVALLIGLGQLSVGHVSAQSEMAPVELAGTTWVTGELTETGYQFSDKELNYCIAKATLIHVDGEQYELRVNEEDCGPRLSIWDLTINDEGDVGGTFMTTVVDPPSETGSVMGELWLFTGCMMVGDFPELQGTWDGELLHVTTSFGGRCHAGRYWGDPEVMAFFSGDDDPEGPMANGLDWADGPTYVEFGADLVVAE